MTVTKLLHSCWGVGSEDNVFFERKKKRFMWPHSRGNSRKFQSSPVSWIPWMVRVYWGVGLNGRSSRDLRRSASRRNVQGLRFRNLVTKWVIKWLGRNRDMIKWSYTYWVSWVNCFFISHQQLPNCSMEPLTNNFGTPCIFYIYTCFRN